MNKGDGRSFTIITRGTNGQSFGHCWLWGEGLASAMAMEVLSRCPRLQVFSCLHIPAQGCHPASSEQQSSNHRPVGSTADPWTHSSSRTTVTLPTRQSKEKKQLSSFNDSSIVPSAKCGKLSSFEFGDSSPRTVTEEAQWVVQT